MIVGKAIVCKQIACINKQSGNLLIRSLPKCFDIADTPCQSTQRVGRSATSIEAAVDVRTVKNGQGVTVIFAQPFFNLRRIDVEVNGGIIHLRLN